MRTPDVSLGNCLVLLKCVMLIYSSDASRGVSKARPWRILRLSTKEAESHFSLREKGGFVSNVDSEDSVQTHQV